MPCKCSAILLIATVLASAAWSQQPPTSVSYDSNAPLPAIVPANRPAIGLALEGGGALGLAHVGVLQWLEEHRIPIDRLSGTSMGALVGALYATGATPAQMRAVAVSDAFVNVFTLETPYADASFRRRQDRRQVPAILTVRLKHKPALRNALLYERGVDEFLSTQFFAYNRQELDYNRIPIPFRCVATDLNTLQSVSFASGPLPLAVRASISIPGVFPPVEDRNGHFLVDGGILDNLPTDLLRGNLHADVVIARHQHVRQLPVQDAHGRPGHVPLGSLKCIVDDITHVQHDGDLAGGFLLKNPPRLCRKRVRMVVRVVLRVGQDHHGGRGWRIGVQ